MESQQIALQPGSLLRNNSYRIERVLGIGGFGITYLATDLSLDRKVAVKEFFPQDYCGREGSTSHVTLGTQSTFDFVTSLKSKFVKEARNIAKFDHPNIIRIHAAFEENNTAYYVMDYIEGISLYDMVKRYGPLTPQRALNFAIRVGAALEYVHMQRMMHLDIKPANIMVRIADETPILIDFGLSKQYDQHGHQTSTSMIGISHGFAPMEQYSDSGITEFSPQTDIYSLAATLYYLLSGEVPLQAPSLIDKELPFPDSIPAPLIAPLQKAMSPGRSRRQETMAIFIQELTAASQGWLTGEVQFNSQAAVAQPMAAHTVLSQQVNSQPVFSQPVNPQPVNSQPVISQPVIPEPVIEEPEHGFHTPYVSEPEPVRISEKVSMGYVPEKIGSNSKLWILVGILGVLALAGGVFYSMQSGEKSALDVSDVIVEETNATGPEGITWVSALGSCHYTGELNEQGIPNGKGKAEFTDGKYKGNVYEGEFVDGVMEGTTIYTCSNGDVFDGTFKNNEYAEGTYTVKSTGETFKGTFKNKQPDKGHWYDKTGKMLE